MSSYFIIESDQISINRILKIFENFPEFDCIGVSKSYSESVEIILKETPSLVFVNIDETLTNPFGIIKEIGVYLDNPPEFIAISFSKEKAYDAFKIGFFDYLINPISELEIRKSTLRLKKKRATNLKNTICLKSYKDYQYLKTNEILFLKADNNTTDFHMIDGNTISAFKTLKTFEHMLPDNFLRIHKSYMVNIDHVSRINFGKSKCTIDRLNQKIPFTKTYLQNVDLLLKELSESSIINQN